MATASVLAHIETADLVTQGSVGDRIQDDGTARLFAAAMICAATVTATSLGRPTRRTVPRSRGAFSVGMAVTWTGIGINRWARLTLGSTYRPRVTVVAGHEVIAAGPYRLVRHPMYLGSILICVGIGCALGTCPTVCAWLLPPVALVRRIGVEEQVLVGDIGAHYTAYQRGRARLLPGIW